MCARYTDDISLPLSAITPFVEGTLSDDDPFAWTGRIKGIELQSEQNTSPISKYGEDTGPYVAKGASPHPPPSILFDPDVDQRSITSSVRNPVFEDGISYHSYDKGRKYAFPNNEVEQNRDDMKHAMCLILMHNKYFYAPLHAHLQVPGVEVLDLGTGTGIWAIEMGEKYPSAGITGNDLSPIQPHYIPGNVQFFVEDIEEDWVESPGKYDFIHIRHVLHSIRDIEKMLQQAYRHLKPGGYIEIQELEYWPYCDDSSVNQETPYGWRDFLVLLEGGMRNMGSELHAIRGILDQLSAAGFEDITKTKTKCPIGLWPKDEEWKKCGLFLRTAIMDGIRGFTQRPLANGLDSTFLDRVRKSVMDARFHTYYFFHVIYARKPLSSTHEPELFTL